MHRKWKPLTLPDNLAKAKSANTQNGSHCLERCTHSVTNRKRPCHSDRLQSHFQRWTQIELCESWTTGISFIYGCSPNNCKGSAEPEHGGEICTNWTELLLGVSQHYLHREIHSDWPEWQSSTQSGLHGNIWSVENYTHLFRCHDFLMLFLFCDKRCVLLAFRWVQWNLQVHHLTTAQQKAPVAVSTQVLQSKFSQSVKKKLHFHQAKSTQWVKNDIGKPGHTSGEPHHTCQQLKENYTLFEANHNQDSASNQPTKWNLNDLWKKASTQRWACFVTFENKCLAISRSFFFPSKRNIPWITERWNQEHFQTRFGTELSKQFVSFCPTEATDDEIRNPSRASHHLLVISYRGHFRKSVLLSRTGLASFFSYFFHFFDFASSFPGCTTGRASQMPKLAAVWCQCSW